MRRTYIVILSLILIFLGGCGTNNAIQAGATGADILSNLDTKEKSVSLGITETDEAGNCDDTEVKTDTSATIDKSEATTYSPNRYGDGFCLDFCGDEIVAYEGSDIDPNREINTILNKMLYCIQNHAEAIPSDAKFRKPELIAEDISDGGDPDDPNYPRNRYFSYRYSFPVEDCGSFDITVNLYTWIEDGRYYFNSFDGVNITIFSEFDGYEYQACSLRQMNVYELGDSDYSDFVGSWDLIDYYYEESEENSFEQSDIENIAQDNAINDTALCSMAFEYLNSEALKWKNDRNKEGYNIINVSVVFSPTIVSRTDRLVTIEGKINYWTHGGNPTGSLYATVVMDKYSGTVVMTGIN